MLIGEILLITFDNVNLLFFFERVWLIGLSSLDKKNVSDDCSFCSLNYDIYIWSFWLTFVNGILL